VPTTTTTRGNDNITTTNDSPTPPSGSGGGDDDGSAVDPSPAVLETKATYVMARAANVGRASGAAVSSVLLRARTPSTLVPSASRLTLTVAGRWEAIAADPEQRSGTVAVALPPAGLFSAARPALAATKASHFSDADGASSDFSYSVSWCEG
jgi:hypothetical protein